MQTIANTVTIHFIHHHTSIDYYSVLITTCKDPCHLYIFFFWSILSTIHFSSTWHTAALAMCTKRSLGFAGTVQSSMIRGVAVGHGDQLMFQDKT